MADNVSHKTLQTVVYLFQHSGEGIVTCENEPEANTSTEDNSGTLIETKLSSILALN